MWKDEVQKRFFWASIGKELEKVLYELIKAEEEEDAGIYLLLMHYNHACEERLFNFREKEKILKGLSTLIKDSRKHQRLLQEAIERLEERKKDESRARA
ncbi:MAG: hypothetical protein Q8Q97_02525 [bacterium]|nr:hypothetical protein [bacterium]